jgi:hypothetical protein
LNPFREGFKKIGRWLVTSTQALFQNQDMNFGKRALHGFGEGAGGAIHLEQTPFHPEESSFHLEPSAFQVE